MSDHVHTHDFDGVAAHTHVHQELARPVAPLTPDAFIADRQRFWVQFTHFVIACTAGVVIVLLLLALFLL
jgi:hypothetical protein